MIVIYKDEQWEIIKHISETPMKKITHYVIRNEFGEEETVKASAITFINNRG